MARERHDAVRPGASRPWAVGLAVLAIILVGSAIIMATGPEAALFFVIITFSIAGWYLVKALGGRDQPLSHGGRRYEPPDENEQDVA